MSGDSSTAHSSRRTSDYDGPLPDIQCEVFDDLFERSTTRGAGGRSHSTVAVPGTDTSHALFPRSMLRELESLDGSLSECSAACDGMHDVDAFAMSAMTCPPPRVRAAAAESAAERASCFYPAELMSTLDSLSAPTAAAAAREALLQDMRDAAAADTRNTRTCSNDRSASSVTVVIPMNRRASDHPLTEPTAPGLFGDMPPALGLADSRSMTSAMSAPALALSRASRKPQALRAAPHTDDCRSRDDTYSSTDSFLQPVTFMRPDSHGSDPNPARSEARSSLSFFASGVLPSQGGEFSFENGDP